MLALVATFEPYPENIRRIPIDHGTVLVPKPGSIRLRLNIDCEVGPRVKKLRGDFSQMVKL